MLYPGEKDLNDKQGVAIFTPYPGLPLLIDPDNKGFRLLEKDFSKFSRSDGPVVGLFTISIEKMRAVHREARGTARNLILRESEFFC